MEHCSANLSCLAITLCITISGAGSKPFLMLLMCAALQAGPARGFTEDDQTALYQLTQAGAVSGKVGLGKAGALKKVAGARWQGTRTVLGSDSEGEEEEGTSADRAGPKGVVSQEGGGGDEGQCDGEQAGVVIVAPRSARGVGGSIGPGAASEPQASGRSSKKGKKKLASRKGGDAASAQAAGDGGLLEQAARMVCDKKGSIEPPEAGPTVSGDDAKPVKWRKLALRALRGEASGQLSMKALTARLLAEVAKSCDPTIRKRFKREMMGVVGTSSKFVVAADGSSVSIRSSSSC